MNRRGFIGALLGAAAAGLAFDPEKALWTPGKKLISIPAPTPVKEYQYIILAKWPIGTLSYSVDHALDADSIRLFYHPDPRSMTMIGVVPKRAVEKRADYKF